jgi:hypothetical protein
MELVSNLREMGDVLRANAERLLHDIQSIHSRMVRELEKVGPGVPAGSEPDRATDGPTDADSGNSEQSLEIPDFVSRA